VPQKDPVYLMVGRYLSMAMMLPAATFVGYVIGWLLDRWLGTTYLKIVFLFVGIAAGFLSLIRELSRDSKRSDSPE
jgi:F0F1-type ATP synthase assembly protein I